MGRLRSIRLRLTLWYVALVAITLAAFAGGLYFALQASLYGNLDDSIEGRVGLIGGLLTNDGSLDTGGVEIPGDPVEGEEFVRVYDANGALVLDNSAEHSRPPEAPRAVAAALAGERSWSRTSVGDVRLRVLTAPLLSDTDVIGVLEAGLSEDDVRDTLSLLLLIIAVASPLALIATSGGGVWLAGRALSPIDDVTRTARQIGVDDLSRRLNLDLPDDEVGRLATTFDDMLSRLEEAFERQRQFTADASHELRTPLTTIKGQAEVALQRDRPADEYRAVLARVNTEVDRLIRLVGSLLTLARADAARIPMDRESINLSRLVGDAVESMRPAAALKQQTVAYHPAEELQVVADQDLILQAVLNLLDNAVHYTPPGGRITVSLGVMGAQAEIAVADTGPGIAAEHLPRIFDRFYRVDRARSRAAGGAGLGLSICRWIAEAHGGSITAQSAPGAGSAFFLRLPIS